MVTQFERDIAAVISDVIDNEIYGWQVLDVVEETKWWETEEEKRWKAEETLEMVKLR